LVQGNNTVGYFAVGTFGGSPSSPMPFGINYSSIEKITFSNDTSIADTRGNFPSNRAIALSLNTNEYGYVISGRANSASGSTGIGGTVRISFNNDTTTHTTLTNLGPGLTLSNGTSVKNSAFGYLVGGTESLSFPTSTSQIYRMTFSSDSSLASARLVLDTARGHTVSSENNNFGWIFGGYLGSIFLPSAQPGNAYSLTSRMDFSADTNMTIVRGPVGQNAFSGSSIQNQNYSWIVGGLSSHFFTPSSPTPIFSTSLMNSLWRFDFSNDTFSATNRVPSISGNIQTAWSSAVSDNTYGWVSGGTLNVPSSLTLPPPGPAAVPIPLFFDASTSLQSISNVSRLTFSNDTATVSTRGSMNQSRRNSNGINGNNV
jgi:hypothetical protein